MCFVNAELIKKTCSSSGTQILEFRNTRFELVKRKIMVQACAYWSSGIQGHGPGIHQEQGSSARSKSDYFSKGIPKNIYSDNKIIFFISNRRLSIFHLRRMMTKF